MPQRDELEEWLIEQGFQSWEVADGINQFDELVDDGVDPNDAIVMIEERFS